MHCFPLSLIQMLRAHTSCSLRALNLSSPLHGPLDHDFDFLNRSRQQYIQGRGKGRVYLQNWQGDLVEKSINLGQDKGSLKSYFWHSH